MIPLYFTIVSTLVIAGVLLASGIAKLRKPDDEAGWEELGVPAALRRPWVIALHPIGEIALAAALLFVGGILGVVAAIAAALLFGVYLVMVWRAKSRTPDASCACFGERKPITTRTLLRNSWLSVLAVISVLGIDQAPLWGGVAVPAAAAWQWTLGLAAVAVTFVLIDQPAASETVAGSARSELGPDDELDDYLRARTPSVPVILGDGTEVSLRDLSLRQPLLLLSVSETCGSCKQVIARADEFRALLPELSVRLLVRPAPELSALVSAEEPQTLHDVKAYARDSLELMSTPAAVLLGADGLLAGGPVTGQAAIESFIGDIYESLHGERPPQG